MTETGLEVLRYAAFTRDPAGGNPAGVVLDGSGLSAPEMQRIAAEVGYSETAFLTPTGPADAEVRYFAPLAEVPFCGHATIAAAVARAGRSGVGVLTLASPVGPIRVETREDGDGILATLTSVPTRVTELDPETTERLLVALRISPDELDPDLPLRVGFAGEDHPVVGVPLPALDRLDYDHDALSALMAEQGWETTVAVVTRTGPYEFEARNPFPPGGIREDPATGAAAAAFGGYLRALGLVTPPATIVVRQGRHVGRPGVIHVDIPPGEGGIAVSGHAVPIV